MNVAMNSRPPLEVSVKTFVYIFSRLTSIHSFIELNTEGKSWAGLYWKKVMSVNSMSTSAIALPHTQKFGQKVRS